MIVCDLKIKHAWTECPTCCFEEIEIPETECGEVSWDQWERITSTKGEKNLQIEEIIEKYDELIPGKLATVKGTLKIHQVLSVEAGKISHRQVSCFCTHAEMKPCSCYQPQLVDMRNTESHSKDLVSTPNPPRQHASVKDLSGKFVIVTYDELPYIGQVLEVVEEEVQVSSMRQSGENNDSCGHKFLTSFSTIGKMFNLSSQNLSQQPHDSLN
ncbi:hypothetical protein F7725_017644 [Dissostichus mawsoni]|uniref:Uncharacterized protein n=1 Tax=Dissostichus mawsoni TaxID=36200 RepID=A0A7J5Z6X0_DISMA|nr:hypothetical protein F7725_017644 [Dissostichus mawsoni]